MPPASNLAKKALQQALSDGACQQGDALGVMEASWRLFSDGGPDRDDATALLLVDTSPRPAQRYECDLTPETIANLRSFCERWAAFAGIKEDTAYKVVLACDEILTNIYRHAYHSRVGPVRCDAALDENRLSYCFVHWGDGLSSSEIPPAQGSSTSGSGGYGLPFVHQVFDEVQFERSNDHSAVTLTKQIPPAGNYLEGHMGPDVAKAPSFVKATADKTADPPSRPNTPEDAP